MATKDPRIDAYIKKSADFAKPVMEHLRRLVHIACPEVQETMKWSFPHFDYGDGILCNMAAFKQHCSFGFWKAALMKDKDKLLTPIGKSAMGNLGRITSLKDLPPDKVIIAYIKEAMRLNEEGVKIEKPKPAPVKELATPDDFTKALNKIKAAKKVFEEFSPGKRKDYIEWITGAKTEVTRKKRIETAVEWISEGKSRNWKYEK
jgi:uncharacterized protein YdeI (YjbR/CyaY-like superfamily)